MKTNISAMLDGELNERAAGETIDALSRGGEALETWRTYHLISDAMRDSRVLSDGFTARVSARLAAEPTVVAPGRRAAEPRRWYPLSAAASLAAVGLVGWLAFSPQQASGPAQTPIAQAPTVPAVVQATPAVVPLPTSTNDYLLAHQGFSPRVSLGMAPYVRTVSEQPQDSRK
jgi:sigma-E factor negative regulatory protein RseA